VKEKNETAQQIRDAVNNIVKNLEAKLAKGEMKATLGDFIRLVQLQKEIGEEQPSEMTVFWVDEPCEKE
jgi:hypothetical protein